MAKKSKQPHSLQVVITGDPVDGITLHGPFDNDDDAVAWAEREVDTDTWWVADLHDPDEEV